MKKGYAINLTSSVPKSNHAGWSYRTFRTGQVTAGSHIPGPSIFTLAKVSLYLK